MFVIVEISSSILLRTLPSHEKTKEYKLILCLTFIITYWSFYLLYDQWSLKVTSVMCFLVYTGSYASYIMPAAALGAMGYCYMWWKAILSSNLKSLRLYKWWFICFVIWSLFLYCPGVVIFWCYVCDKAQYGKCCCNCVQTVGKCIWSSGGE